MDIHKTIKFSPNTKEGSWDPVMIKSENIAHDFVDEKHCKMNDNLSKTKVDTLKLSAKCSKEFKIAHSRKRRKKTFFKCKFCKSNHLTEDDLTKHMMIHAKREFHICNICSQGFRRKGDLIEHLRRHYDMRPHKCQVCGKGFLRAYLCKAHMRYHTGERPFECDICKEKFALRCKMKSHIIMKHVEFNEHFNCSVCMKPFKTASRLEDHMLTHTEFEASSSNYCSNGKSEKKVSRPKRIKSSRLSQKCRNRYVCDICGKVFLRRSSFNTHINTRSSFPNGQAYLECKICKQKFCHKRTLALHENIEHIVLPFPVIRADDGEISFRLNNFQTGNLKTYERNRNVRVNKQSNVAVVKTEPESEIQDEDSHLDREQKSLGKVTERESSILCSVKKEPENTIDLSCNRSPIGKKRKIRRKSESGSSASNSNCASTTGETDIQKINLQRANMKTYQRKKKIISGEILDNHSNHTSVVVKTESENIYPEEEPRDPLYLTESESVPLFPSIKKETFDALDLSYEIEISEVKIEIEEGRNTVNEM